MIFFVFLAAFALSACAGLYSVIGLAAIFPGSYWPIIIMGSVLEGSKLVTTSWVYHNWHTAPKMMKYYMVSAIIILMMITSMGIFGYLSKAHLEHSADMSPLLDKVALLDEKIKNERENINANRKVLKQLDEGVDQIMARSSDEKGADKALAIRKTQAKDRSRLSQEISESQKTINAINEERTPINVALQKAESDFGPIKYVAELIYGSGDRDIIDKAVRLVIILIMIVFDPLAVLLLIAGNMSLKENKKEDILFYDTDVVEKSTDEVLKDIEESYTEPEPVKPKDAIIPDIGSPIDTKQEKALKKRDLGVIGIKSNFKMANDEEDINFYKRNT
jgi:hypothetical protein